MVSETTVHMRDSSPQRGENGEEAQGWETEPEGSGAQFY